MQCSDVQFPGGRNKNKNKYMKVISPLVRTSQETVFLALEEIPGWIPVDPHTLAARVLWPPLEAAWRMQRFLAVMLGMVFSLVRQCLSRADPCSRAKDTAITHISHGQELPVPWCALSHSTDSHLVLSSYCVPDTFHVHRSVLPVQCSPKGAPVRTPV